MNLIDEIQNCQLCPLRNQIPDCCTPVPGKGRVNATLMFIGEAVNETDVMVGEPYVCKNGQLLYTILKDTEISPDDVYMTNLIKCSGKISSKTLQKCSGWLLKEIAHISPSGLILSGKKVTEYFKIDYTENLYKVVDNKLIIPSLHKLLMGSSKDLIKTKKGIKEFYGISKKR